MGTVGANPPFSAHSNANFSLQLKRFSGASKENPEAHLRQLKYAKEISKWDDLQALCYAGLQMDGKAAEWFSNNNFTRWEAFEKAFLERFGLDPSKMLTALSRRVQGKDE